MIKINLLFSLLFLTFGAMAQTKVTCFLYAYVQLKGLCGQGSQIKAEPVEVVKEDIDTYEGDIKKIFSKSYQENKDYGPGDCKMTLVKPGQVIIYYKGENDKSECSKIVTFYRGAEAKSFEAAQKLIDQKRKAFPKTVFTELGRWPTDTNK